MPWPAEYSGSTDLYYRMAALHQMGVKIHFHCLQKRPVPIPPEMDAICHSIEIHETKMDWFTASMSLPYTVRSHASKALIVSLKKDDYAIKFEGINACHALFGNALKARNIFIRLHAVKHIDFAQLAAIAKNWLRRRYYKFESASYFRFKRQIVNKAQVLAINENDRAIYQSFGAQYAHWLPMFVPHIKLSTQVGKGSFCLYHADLTVPENIEVVKWLIKHIFDNNHLPFVVAGKNPSAALVERIYESSSNCVIENPTDEELKDLIEKAQINIVPTMHFSGINNNVLHSLFLGKHCITNSRAVDGTKLAELCHVIDDPNKIKETLENLFDVEVSAPEIAKRQEVLQLYYNNKHNAEHLLNLMQLK